MVTVLALSVSTYAGTPPIVRSVASKHAANVGNVWSQTGMITRKRDHATHAQNSNVDRNRPSGPGTFGP